jgi:hypothetical protein
MKGVILAAVLAAAFLAVCRGDTSDIGKCTYKSDDGKSFDFSKLIQGGEGFSWTQEVWGTDGDIFINTKYADSVTLQLQVEICRNVSQPIHPTVCKRPFPMYLATVDSKGQIQCNGLGDVRVAKFYRTPSEQGVYLEYFGGESPEGEPDPVRYSTRVYILCQQGTEFTKPELEHIKSFYQVHLRMYSKYACA